jgi:ABC-type nickel/cobalt efflux system permease component RcnA
MDYMSIANSPIMWLACGMGVALVLFQSALFVKKSREIAPKIGITAAQMKSAMMSSLTSSIGPSFVILAGMVSLLGAMADRFRGSVFRTSAPWLMS